MNRIGCDASFLSQYYEIVSIMKSSFKAMEDKQTKHKYRKPCLVIAFQSINGLVCRVQTIVSIFDCINSAPIYSSINL